MENNLKSELEKIQIGMEEVVSLITMFEQALYYGGFSEKTYEMGLSHIIIHSQNVLEKLKGLAGE